jgi:hypothetical protein
VLRIDPRAADARSNPIRPRPGRRVFLALLSGGWIALAGVAVVSWLDRPRDAVAERPIARAPAMTAPAPDRPEPVRHRTIRAHDGSFTITTVFRWSVTNANAAALFAKGTGQTLSARRGDADGGIATCNIPASWWERCRRIHAKTLDELIRAFEPDGAPSQRTPMLLDGKRAVVLTVGGPEVESGGPHVAYILAMHAGRPYAIRIWSERHAGVVGIDEIVAGFRFWTGPPVDGGSRLDRVAGH